MILNNVTTLDPSLKLEERNLKRTFRRIQRQNIFLSEQKELAKFEKIAKERNKNKFWRFIKNNKKKRATIKNVTIPRDKLLDHYSKFFKDDKSDLSQKQHKIQAL